MIRGKGSNPRISNDNRPDDPGGGGWRRNFPLPSNNRKQDISWNLKMNRDGKPVLTPDYETDIHVSGRSVDEKLWDKLVRETRMSQDVTRLDTGGRDWIAKPSPPLVKGVGIVDTDNNQKETGCDTRNTALVDHEWHEVKRKHRYKKSVRTWDYGQIVSEMDNFEAPGTDWTVKTDGCTSPVEDIRPEGGLTEDLAKGGLRLLEPLARGDRCVKRNEKKKRYTTGWRSGHVRKLLSARLRPWAGRSPQMLNEVVPHGTERDHPVIVEPMHYEWIKRKYVTNADLPVRQNYLEIPSQLLPMGILHLAEEARDLGVMKESSGFMEDVQAGSSQWSGSPLIEVLTPMHGVRFGRESGDLEVLPGRLVEEQPIASVDSGVLLIGQSDYRNDTARRSGGQEDCFGKPIMEGCHYDSAIKENGIDCMTYTKRRMYMNPGPLGFQMIITNGSEQEEWPETMKQVSLPRPTVDREEFSPVTKGHTADTMLSSQPVAEGLLEPIAVHRPDHDYANIKLGDSRPVSRDSRSECKQSDDIDLLSVQRGTEDMASRSGMTEQPDDCSGDVTCTETIYDESDMLARELDPLRMKDTGYQLVRVNGGLDNCLREKCGSSDSGVQSWTEQWENMSDVSLIDSYDNTGDTLPEIPEEMSRLLFGAPPNSEVGSDSDCPVTDSSVTDTCDSCSSENMSDEDEYGADRKWEIPTSEVGDFDSDIAVLSDFSDDSSIFGIRKVLRNRVPYRGRKPQFKHGLAPAPRTPPVKAKTHAERWQYEKGTTRAQYTRWLYGTPLDHKEEDFVGYVRYFTNICLKVSHDPRLDRYYPRLVRSLARAARVVRTLPHCRGNHRRRRDLMMRLFDDDMEQSDVARDRFPDRHVQKFTNRPRDKPESTKVRGTRTPPIYRNHHRKYAALRVSESDVDDYFGGAEEEWRWTVRGVTWYRPPPKCVRRRPRDD